jgi:hypothetical protein
MLLRAPTHSCEVPNLISRKLKLFLIAGGVAALIATLASAIYTRADLANGSASELAKPDAGQILPSQRRGIFACAMPISDCEKIMIILPINLKFSPLEIDEAIDRLVARSL